MVSMTKAEIYEYLNSITSLLGFNYNGIPCSIDPFSENDFILYCGDAALQVDSLDRAMNEKFFEGKSLSDIADEIEITEC